MIHFKPLNSGAAVGINLLPNFIEAGMESKLILLLSPCGPQGTSDCPFSDKAPRPRKSI